jgi:hypothetical protein
VLPARTIDLDMARFATFDACAVTCIKPTIKPVAGPFEIR